MLQRIEINPVTRIEGHAKISILVDEQGVVEDAQLHITQFRGFEKLCEGRPFYEMPSLMARTCGICPVSHLIASAKACDALLAVRIPPTAANLRRILNLAQMIQSHALSFFHLSSPDFVFGMDGDPEERNIVGLYLKNPDMAREGIRLRQIGQRIIERLGGKRIHPAWVVPGGVGSPLSEKHRDEILADLPEALAITRKAIKWFKGTFKGLRREIDTLGNFPSLFMGLVNSRGGIEHYDGWVRIVDSAGNIIADGLEPHRYFEFIEEAVEPFSYMKSPFYKPHGYPGGMYRVGPLARLNIIDRCGAPFADQEWAEFRELDRGAILNSFHYHYARLVEIIYGIEKIEQLLADPDILSTHIRAHAEPNSFEGVGVAEAPRGTLIHHYKIDEQGLVTWANLIIATGHNNLAMNRSVLQAAKNFVQGAKIKEGMLNRVEAVVRAYDPCLSCATHAAGAMPIQVDLISPGGEVLDTVRRA